MGSLQLVHPKASPSASTNCCSPPFPRNVMEKFSSSPLENTLGCCIVLPSRRLALGYHHRILVCLKEDTRPCCATHSDKYVSRGPCYPKALTLETGQMIEGKLSCSNLEAESKGMTADPCILAFHKELESDGLEMERATAYLRWTTTVREERCSSLDMVLRKKTAPI